MPHSLRDNDREVRDYVRKHDITSVLDVGAGAGTYGHLLSDIVPWLEAIEVWRPYINQFDLKGVYDEVHLGDVRDLAYAGFSGNYDLIIFGDIMEHMSEEEGQKVWAWAKTIARHGLISVPIVHWPQGPVHGNPFEAHVQDHLHVEDIERLFGPFSELHLYEQTATFLTEFSA